MGYINHHAIIVTAWGTKYIEPAHKRAKEIFGDSCSEIVPSQINGYVSFFIAPDGSKEGWSDSNSGDIRREEFKDFVRNSGGFLDAVLIYYGGDEPDLKDIEIIE